MAWLEILHMDSMLWLSRHIIFAMLLTFFACDIAQCQCDKNGNGDGHANGYHDEFIVDVAVWFACSTKAKQWKYNKFVETINVFLVSSKCCGFVGQLTITIYSSHRQYQWMFTHSTFRLPEWKLWPEPPTLPATRPSTAMDWYKMNRHPQIVDTIDRSWFLIVGIVNLRIFCDARCFRWNVSAMEREENRAIRSREIIRNSCIWYKFTWKLYEFFNFGNKLKRKSCT